MRTRLLLVGVVVLATAPCLACSHVAPYERGRLAHPTMEDAHGVTATADHVHAVHEGAVGGSSLAASGCGCN